MTSASNPPSEDRPTVSSKPTCSAVAKGIKQASEKYIEDYWNKRRGDKVDENKALEELIEFITKKRSPESNEAGASCGCKVEEKEDKNATADKDVHVRDKEAIRKILDTVAKHNMSTYYNMLLPQAVCVFFYLDLHSQFIYFCIVAHLRCF